MQQAALFEEIVVDNFAGGGGASTGIEIAIGRSPEVAINHDEDAISMHMVNHPHTEHYCESVWDVVPRVAAAGRPVGLVWLSPDCKHFSKAKGGTPVEKKIRGLAWVALRWIAQVRPRVLMLENVEEFTTWGPLIVDAEGKHRPDPKKKGRTFKSFINAMRRHGYEVDWKELRACDYGAPTIRKRLFLVARRDQQKIVWPKPTHGNPQSKEVKAGLLKPWRTTAEIIDWSRPCPSIFDRKRPLVEATLRRIAKGIQKFILEAEDPFIVNDMITPFITEHANASSQRNMSVEDPLRTICAQVKGGHFAVVTPVIAPVIARQFGKSIGHAIDSPLGAVTAGGSGKSQLVTAFLAKHYTGVTGVDMLQPLPTVTTVDHNALVTSHLVKLRGTCQHGQPITDPMPTITAGGLHVGEVRTLLYKYNSQNDDLYTVAAKGCYGLVTIRGEEYQIVDIGMRMLEPHELFAAQGFPDDYIIDHDAEGNPFTKTAQIARCGNAVCPPLAAALVRANLPEMCREHIEKIAA